MSYIAIIRFEESEIVGTVYSYPDRELALKNSEDFTITRYIDQSVYLGKWRYFYRGEEVELLSIQYSGV